MKSFKKFGVVLAAAALLAVGCADSNNGDTANNFNNVNAVGNPNGGGAVNPAPAQPGAGFVQVEQFARPGIAEALLLTNKSLATYNAVGPDFIAAALVNGTSAQGVAANSTLTEALGTLAAFAALSPAPVKPTALGLALAFLPDVQRIDTTVPGLTAVNGTEKSAYAARLNTAGSPVAGRKLTDDVIDITLTVLTGGGVTTDNVPYYRPTAGNGSTNFGIGHQRLNGQTANFGPSSFPFLAPAN